MSSPEHTIEPCCRGLTDAEKQPGAIITVCDSCCRAKLDEHHQLYLSRVRYRHWWHRLTRS